jgi:phosphomannomutase
MSETNITKEERLYNLVVELEIAKKNKLDTVKAHSEEVKNKIVANCKANAYTSFGKYQVQRVEDLDGWKFFISDEEWIMIRASGTEPVLRTYAETSSRELAFEMLEACKKTLLG